MYVASDFGSIIRLKVPRPENLLAAFLTNRLILCLQSKEVNELPLFFSNQDLDLRFAFIRLGVGFSDESHFFDILRV